MPPFGSKPADSPASKQSTIQPRMIVDASQCTFCGMCAKRCTKGAITVRRDKRLHQFNAVFCDGCQDCTKVCPKRGLQVML